MYNGETRKKEKNILRRRKNNSKTAEQQEKRKYKKERKEISEFQKNSSRAMNVNVGTNARFKLVLL